MAGKIIKLPNIANPTIEEVLDEFLAEQRNRLKPRTMAKYEDIVGLLKSCLDNYAYQGLSEAESALFDRHYEAEGEEHREFCQVFGPEKIPENLSYFLGFFMIRKVWAGKGLKAAAGTVTRKLSEWLAGKDYITEEDSLEGAEEGAAAARDLPRAEEAAQILYEAGGRLVLDPEELADEDYVDFDHHTIKKVEPGKLWLEVYEGGSRTIGPLEVPKKATDLIKKGWEMSCALGRMRGKWRIVEMGNIYPL